MTVGQFLGVWGAVAIVHSAAIVFLVVRAYRAGTPEQLQSEVRQLGIDVEELYTAVEKWTKRRYAAEARNRKEELAAPAAPDRADKGQYKAYLRQKAKGAVQ